MTSTCPREMVLIEEGLNRIDVVYVMRLCLVFILLLFCVCAAEAETQKDNQKVYETRLNYQIVVPSDPTPVVGFAADELKSFLAKTYTAAVLLNGSKAPTTFYVGFQESDLLDRFDGTREMLKQKKFGIFCRDRDILLTGYDDNVEPLEFRGLNGSLCAVYYFLTKYAGVGFYFPGDKGVEITTNKPLVLSETDDIPEPSFSVRGFQMANNEFTKEDHMLFFKRMLNQVPLWAVPDASYTCTDWTKTIGQEHPEYLSLYNGQRTGKSPYQLPCMSNPEVVRKVADDVIDIFRKNPSFQTVHLFLDGPHYPCQCETCMASKERQFQKPVPIAGESKPGLDTSEEYFTFVAKIGKIVLEEFPDKNLDTLTKFDRYSHCPVTMERWDPRIQVNLLTRRGQNGNDTFEIRLAEAKDWVSKGARVIIRSYPRHPRHKNYPLMNPEYTARYFRKFQGIAQGSIKSDLNKNSVPYSFCALNQYVQAKILFNTSLSVSDLTDAFVTFCYPGAEKEMNAFYREMEHLWDESRLDTDPLSGCYRFENLRKPMALLESARKQVTGNRFLIERLYEAFSDFYRISEKRSLQGEG